MRRQEEFPSTGQLPKEPHHHDLRGHLLELYARTLLHSGSPSVFISAYARRRAIPSKARGFLASTLFSWQRNRFRTRLLFAHADTPRAALKALPASEEHEALLSMVRWLQEEMHQPPEKTVALVLQALKAVLARPADAALPVLDWPQDPAAALEEFSARLQKDPELRHAPESIRRAARFSIPPAIMDRWVEAFGEVAAEQAAIAAGRPAALAVRLRSRDPEQLLVWRSAIKRAGGDIATADEHGMVVLRRKLRLDGIPGLAPADYQVQDASSQLVCRALAPKPGWRVLDACAGAGGKSLHLADLIGPQGQVLAHDQDAARLEETARRAAGAGLGTIRLLQPGTAAGAAPYDAVLIDAPCLGHGRLNREPSLAWRGPLAARLQAITDAQRACLAEYAPLLRPGGVLVYAVCSIEPEETTEMAAWTERNFPDLEREWATSQWKSDGNGLILPDPEGLAEGFFIARWRRN